MGKKSAKSDFDLSLSGFSKYYTKLEQAGADIDALAKRAIRDSAQVAAKELEAKARKAGVSDSIRADIKVEIESYESGYYTAKVGWKKGAYNPRNPSTAYLALFWNYGTIKRQTLRGYNRGSQPKSGNRPAPEEQFIRQAIKSSKTKINRIQKNIFNEILGGLK